MITTGHLKQNYLSLNDLWDKKYGPPIFRATMPKCRFIALTRFMRFDNKETRTARRAADKLAPIRDLFNEINSFLLRYYTPSEYLTVDEQLVPFRGRCLFRQYTCIPSKPDKYGMKIFWICDAKSFYPLKAKPCLGKEEKTIKQHLSSTEPRPESCSRTDQSIYSFREKYHDGQLFHGHGVGHNSSPKWADTCWNS